MKTLFAQIEASAKVDDLDEAVRPIQGILGQDDGGPAAMFFDFNEEDVWPARTENDRKQRLIRYCVYELGTMEFAL